MFVKVSQMAMGSGCLTMFLQLDGYRAKYDASLYLVDDSVRAIRKSVHGLDYDEDDAANLTAVSSVG